MASDRPELPPPRAALQPAAVERGLLGLTFQRVARGETAATGQDRHDLALRALGLLQDGPGGVATGDPLRQIGLQRQRIGTALPLAGGRAAGLELLTVRGRGGSIRRQAWQTGGGAGPSLHLSLLNVDTGFSRLDDLTAEERGWVGQMRGMRRLEFGGERVAMAGGLAELGVLQLADGGARARRLALGFAGSRWSIHALSQRADDGFKRLADLNEADRKLFGAERGITRDALDLGYALEGGRRLAVSSLTLRSAVGVAERRLFEYGGGPKLQLRLLTGRVDSRFDRIGDLLEADRGVFAPRRGMRWSDLQANLQPARWLTTENQWYRGTSLETGLRSGLQRHLWALQLAPKSKLVLLRNLLETPSGHAGRQHALTQSVRLEQWLTRSLFFSGFRETVASSLTGSSESLARRLAFHLNTAPGPHWQGSADWSAAAGPDGKDERRLQWSLALPLRRGLALQAKGDRRETVKGLGAQSLALGLAGQIARQWNLGLTLNGADPGKGPATSDIGLRLTFAGLPDTPRFHETRLVLGIGDTTGIASAVPVLKKGEKAPPPRLGPPARRVRSVSLETKVGGRPVALGYTGAAGTAGGLTYHLASDPKRRLQFEATRELRDLGRTSLIARQRYAFHACLPAASQLSLSYENHPELQPGQLLLGHTQTKIEAQTGTGHVHLTAATAWDQDRVRGTTRRLTSLGLTGSLDRLNSLKVGYIGRGGPPDPALPTRDFHLAYERKPSELLRLALQLQWQAWDGKRADELAWQLDVAAVF